MSNKIVLSTQHNVTCIFAREQKTYQGREAGARTDNQRRDRVAEIATLGDTQTSEGGLPPQHKLQIRVGHNRGVALQVQSAH